MESSTNRLLDSMKWPVAFVSSWWIILMLEGIMGWDLGYLGVFPLEWFGLRGVLTAPFIHGDFSHLISKYSDDLFADRNSGLAGCTFRFSYWGQRGCLWTGYFYYGYWDLSTKQ